MNYSLINPRIWKGGTGKQILTGVGDAGMIVALYLVTSPHANQSGVYYCPIAYIAVETSRTAEEVERCLVGLEKIGFIRYDYDAEVVWVMNMVKFQVQSWPSNGDDKRRKGVLNSLSAVPDTCLISEFLEYWGIDNSTVSTEGPLARGLQGASKGLPEIPVTKLVSGGVA